MCLGVPGQLLDRREDESGLAMGRVSFGGTIRDVCLAHVPEARPGDYVIVHVGFALNVVDEAEARRTFELLRELEAAAEASDPPAPE